MIAMDQTIAGAASGETARNMRRRRVHNLRQKDRRVLNIILLFLLIRNNRYYFLFLRLKRLELPISFFYVVLLNVHIFTCEH
jgi:hypothetical protein